MDDLEKKEPTGIPPNDGEDKYRELVEPEDVVPLSKRELPPLVMPTPQNIPVKTVRTLETDIAENISDGLTLSNIVVAQNNRAAIEPEREESTATRFGKRFWIKAGIGAFFIILLISIVISFSNNRTEIPTQGDVALAPASDIIFLNEAKEVNISGKEELSLINTLEAERVTFSGVLGSIRGLYFTAVASDTPKHLVTAPQFLSALSLTIPPNLLRSLDDRFVYGIHAFDGNQPFIIFKDNFYENAFAGMLAWEGSMKSELGPIFKRQKLVVTIPTIPTSGETGGFQTSTTSSDSTGTIVVSNDGTAAITPTNRSGFVDMVIKNRDVRALLDENGQIQLLYTFSDKNTLIITNNENTLKEVLDRLTAGKVVQ